MAENGTAQRSPKQHCAIAIAFRTSEHVEAGKFMESVRSSRTSLRLRYDKDFQAPHLLSKDDLASQVRRYVESSNLNIVPSAKVQWTGYDTVAQKWNSRSRLKLVSAGLSRSIFVMAAGIGFQKPYIPSNEDPGLYRGVSIHSAEYTNAEVLKERGVKSVLIIGCANTAFDVLADCHDVGCPENSSSAEVAYCWKQFIIPRVVD